HGVAELARVRCAGCCAHRDHFRPRFAEAIERIPDLHFLVNVIDEDGDSFARELHSPIKPNQTPKGKGPTCFISSTERGGRRTGGLAETQTCLPDAIGFWSVPDKTKSKGKRQKSRVRLCRLHGARRSPARWPFGDTDLFTGRDRLLVS